MAACVCYNTCYQQQPCTCDHTNHGYVGCTCDVHCYGQGQVCTCDMLCYGYIACTCDNTTYGATSCGCNNACYGDKGCSCDFHCYQEASVPAGAPSLRDTVLAYKYEGGYGSGGYGEFFLIVSGKMFPDPTNEGDATLFGCSHQFSGIEFLFATPGVGGAYIWEYWTGSQWTTLTVQDGTSKGTLGLTQDGWINWLEGLRDWVLADIPSTGTPKYWVRCRVFTPPSTTPNISSMWITYAGQTCRGVYVANGTPSCKCNYTCYDYSPCFCNLTAYGGSPCECDQACYGDFSCSCDMTCYTEVAATYVPDNRDLNNCYVFAEGTFAKPIVESGLQQIIDRLKTAGTIAIINPLD